MNSRHRKTLDALYERPERADIAWREIEVLLLALGAEVSEGAGFLGDGDRVRVVAGKKASTP